MNTLDYLARDFEKTRNLKKAIYCMPLGLGTFERKQRLGETLLEGPQGFYFVKLSDSTKRKSHPKYEYEYFGANDLPSGIAHMRKADVVKMLQDKLNAQ